MTRVFQQTSMGLAALTMVLQVGCSTPSATVGSLIEPSGEESASLELISLAVPQLPGGIVAEPVEPSVQSLAGSREFLRELLRLTNRERYREGLAPLAWDQRLGEAAQRHAIAMAKQDFFAHTNPHTGTNPGDRIEARGYDWRAYGENIAAGYSTPESVMEGWMNSSGHRANILNSNFEDVGLGYYYQSGDTGSANYSHYWVQVFGKEAP